MYALIRRFTASHICTNLITHTSVSLFCFLKLLHNYYFKQGVYFKVYVENNYPFEIRAINFILKIYYFQSCICVCELKVMRFSNKFASRFIFICAYLC